MYLLIYCHTSIRAHYCYHYVTNIIILRYAIYSLIYCDRNNFTVNNFQANQNFKTSVLLSIFLFLRKQWRNSNLIIRNCFTLAVLQNNLISFTELSI